jgi:hypothetical protein
MFLGLPDPDPLGEVRLICDFFYLKYDVNVASISEKQNNL